RDTIYPSSGMTPRGSGDHQPRVFLRNGIGKIPARYAASNVPGARSAPMPHRPLSSASSGAGSRQRFAGGSIGGSAISTATFWSIRRDFDTATGRSSVRVETLLRLASETSRGNHLAQRRGRFVRRVAERVVDGLEDRHRRV